MNLHNHRGNGHDSKVDNPEFGFWAFHDNQYHDCFHGEDGSHGLGIQDQLLGEFDDCKTQLWNAKTSPNVACTNESSPLLSHSSHVYDNASQRSRREFILEGRSKLMEMIQDLPETYYDLSLKDIVEVTHREAEEELKEINKMKPKRKAAHSVGSGNISRTGSMEKEAFLIKIFVPTLSLKKRLKGIGSDSSRNQNQVEKKSRIMKFGHRGEGIVSGRSSSSGSTSSSSTCSSYDRSKKRYENTNSSLGCWSFFFTKDIESNKMQIYDDDC